MTHDDSRKPWLAFLLSILAPGLGHLYAGSFRGGGIALLVSWVATTLAVLSIDARVEVVAGQQRRKNTSRKAPSMSREHIIGIATHLYSSRAPVGGVRRERIGQLVR